MLFLKTFNNLINEKYDGNYIKFLLPIVLIATFCVASFIFITEPVIFLVLILGLIGSIAFFFAITKSYFFVWTFIFIAPLYYFPAMFMFEAYYDPSSVSESMFLLKVGKDIFWLFVVVLFIFKLLFKNELFSNISALFKNKNNRLIAILLISFICYVLSLAFIGRFNIGLTTSIISLRPILEFTLAFFIIYSLLKKPKDFKILLILFLISSCFVILDGIVQALIIAKTQFGSRIFSTLLQPNNLGLYMSFILLLSIPIHFYFIRRQCSKKINLLFQTFIFLCLVVLILTVSLTSISTFFIGYLLILLAMFINKHNYFKIISTKTIIIVSTLIFLLLPVILIFSGSSELRDNVSEKLSYLKLRSENIINNKDGSANYRKIIIKNYIIEVKNNSAINNLFGSRFTKPKPKDEIYDNSYLLIHHYTGFFGLLLIILITIASSVKAFSVYIKNKDPLVKGISLGIAVYLLVYMWACYYSEFMNNLFPHNFLYWAIIGVVLALNSKINLSGVRIKS